VIEKHDLDQRTILSKRLFSHSSYSELNNFNAIGVLIEKIGSLNQVVGKILAYGLNADHPDNQGILKHRLEQEIADLTAIIDRVTILEELDKIKIDERICKKLATFKEWDLQP
jgi:hypothetical protein